MYRNFLSVFLVLIAAHASPLVYHDGEIDTATWEAQLLAAGVSLTTPELNTSWLDFTPSEKTVAHLARVKRQLDCENTALIVDKEENFVDWDVQISPVVCAVGPMQISVNEGYTVTNSLTVGGGLDYKLIKDLLGSQFHVDYSKSWTTITFIQVGATVPDGNCGVMIWKPTTNRKYGSVLQGCIGDMQKVGTFIANDLGHQVWRGVEWIAGARSLCVKPGNNPPLSRCQGSGFFI